MLKERKVGNGKIETFRTQGLFNRGSPTDSFIVVLSFPVYVIRFLKTATNSAVWLFRRQLAYASFKAHHLVASPKFALAQTFSRVVDNETGSQSDKRTDRWK